MATGTLYLWSPVCTHEGPGPPGKNGGLQLGIDRLLQGRGRGWGLSCSGAPGGDLVTMARPVGLPVAWQPCDSDTGNKSGFEHSPSSMCFHDRPQILKCALSQKTQLQAHTQASQGRRYRTEKGVDSRDGQPYCYLRHRHSRAEDFMSSIHTVNTSNTLCPP